MTRLVVRAFCLATRSTLRPPPPISAALRWRLPQAPTAASLSRPIILLPTFFSTGPGRGFFASSRESRPAGPPGGFSANPNRGYRKLRRRLAARRQVPKEKPLELDVKICIEEELPDDPQIMDIAEALRLDVPLAMNVAFDHIRTLEYKTRETSIDDVNKYEKIELSVLLCNDDFIQKLNKDWRDVDHATDVLSMSQHIPELDLPILLLGDIVISVETAARQAEERDHALLDEIRILMVHGLLHLLGFDHEISDEAEEEMEKEEELVLKNLQWKGKGLIKSAYDAVANEVLPAESSDGILLNGRSQSTTGTAEYLREAISSGIKNNHFYQKEIRKNNDYDPYLDFYWLQDNDFAEEVDDANYIFTGCLYADLFSPYKSTEDGKLAGADGAVSETSPGIFLQIMAIGDDTARIMGVALGKWAVNDVMGITNGENDGAEAIYQYAIWGKPWHEMSEGIATFFINNIYNGIQPR